MQDMWDKNDSVTYYNITRFLNAIFGILICIDFAIP